MKLHRTPLALAVAAACGALPLAAHAGPAVSWTTPLNGATLKGAISGAACAVNATGTTRVTFWADNWQINNDYSAPFNCNFDTTRLRDGTYKLRAVAYNGSGASSEADISVTIANSTSTTTNAAPTVSISSPASGATVSGTALAYSANATDDAGVAKVDFFVDSTALVSDTTSPYGGTLDTTRLANGTHTLKAVAYDAQGLSATSQISINVQNSTSTGGTATPPPGTGSLDVWFKAPLAGSTISGTLNGGTSCYVNGTGVVKVDFLLDSTALNTDTTMADGMQCVLDTTRFANGTHSLTAVAYDSSGSKRSDVISVNVQNSATTTNAAPTVSLTSPASGATVSGTAVAYAANATDDAGVARVEFSLDGAALLSDSTSPYGGAFDSTKLANGTHTLKAVAYDAQGLSATSQISINVQNSTSTGTSATATPAPGSGSLDVWFKAPLAGATVSGLLNGGTSCYVNGTGVSKVSFFLDSTAVNTDTTMADGMQCVLDTTKFANGTHTFTATAYDSSGASRNDVISINVQNATSGGTTSGTTGGSTGGSTGTLPANGARAVPTFNSIGLYWTPPSNPGAGCPVVFRKAGDTTWRQGLDMWYDARNNECRGSLVQLQSGTSYEVQLGMPGQSPSAGLTVSTWSEQFPVAQTITLPAGTVTQPLAITQGGSAGGYVVYQGDPSGTTIDVQNAYDANVTISAPYVILRGVTLKNARVNGVDLLHGAHDVVIENNDISGWGRYRSTASNGLQLGIDMDSAIRARCTDLSLERVVIQRNRLHDPRYSANSWSFGHPAGPQGITFSYCGGNHVIRYNEITGSSGHYFNDAIGGEDNFTNTGFPIADTDINGNLISGTWDDGIESEGGNRNNRIWGNYLDQTATGIASTVVGVGPLYIFRNVYNRSRKLSETSTDADDRGPFFKAGTESTVGNGRRYVFHNTILQTPNTSGSYPLGAGLGIAGNTGEPLTNTVIRNNIFHIWKSGWQSIDDLGGYSNDANVDLYNGAINLPSGNESSGIKGLPTYQSGNGYVSGSGGMYQLAPGTSGYGTAMRLPNFNDAYSAPDIGAHQSGTSAMKFGVSQ